MWHGRGSTAQEKQAALTYAQALAPTPSSIIELSEEGDDDEMFWIILGEGDYGKADYWRWKSNSEPRRPRIWLVDSKADSSIVSSHYVTFNKGSDRDHQTDLTCCDIQTDIDRA